MGSCQQIDDKVNEGRTSERKLTHFIDCTIITWVCFCFCHLTGASSSLPELYVLYNDSHDQVSIGSHPNNGITDKHLPKGKKYSPRMLMSLFHEPYSVPNPFSTLYPALQFPHVFLGLGGLMQLF